MPCFPFLGLFLLFKLYRKLNENVFISEKILWENFVVYAKNVEFCECSKCIV